MRRSSFLVSAVIAAAAALSFGSPVIPQTSVAVEAQAAPAVDNSNAPLLTFEASDPVKLPPGMNLGEVLSVAVNSKGTIDRAESSGHGEHRPALRQRDDAAARVRRDGQARGRDWQGRLRTRLRAQRPLRQYDNLWVVDKGTNSAMKFNPAGRVVLNLGRRPEGYAGDYDRPSQADARPNATALQRADRRRLGFRRQHLHRRRLWQLAHREVRQARQLDQDVGLVRPRGRSRQREPEHDQQPAQPRRSTHRTTSTSPIAATGASRCSTPTATSSGSCSSTRRTTRCGTRCSATGRRTRRMRSGPVAICITKGSPQYLFAIDYEPGRLYKMTLDGKIVGMVGVSGHEMGQFNWAHGLACVDENTILVADMNNWRVQKIALKPAARPTALGSWLVVGGWWFGRRRQNHQHQQPATAGVSDAVRNAVGCHDDLAGRHRDLAALEQQHAFAFDHLVQLVHPLMGVQRVRLTGLEGVEPDKQP